MFGHGNAIQKGMFDHGNVIHPVKSCDNRKIIPSRQFDRERMFCHGNRIQTVMS
jgi:hypothetical protein